MKEDIMVLDSEMKLLSDHDSDAEEIYKLMETYINDKSFEIPTIERSNPNLEIVAEDTNEQTSITKRPLIMEKNNQSDQNEVDKNQGITVEIDHDIVGSNTLNDQQVKDDKSQKQNMII